MPSMECKSIGAPEEVIQDPCVCWISADECDWICSSLEGLDHGRSSSDSPSDAVFFLQTLGCAAGRTDGRTDGCMDGAPARTNEAL